MNRAAGWDFLESTDSVSVCRCVHGFGIHWKRAPAASWLVQLVLAGAKPRAPDRSLIRLAESPAGALVQRFGEVLAGNFKLAEDHLRKTVHQRTSEQFSSNYQCPGWCTAKCTSEHQLHQGAGL